MNLFKKVASLLFLCAVLLNSTGCLLYAGYSYARCGDDGCGHKTKHKESK